MLHFSGGEHRRAWSLQGRLDSFLAAACLVWEAVRDADADTDVEEASCRRRDEVSKKRNGKDKSLWRLLGLC